MPIVYAETLYVNYVYILSTEGSHVQILLCHLPEAPTGTHVHERAYFVAFNWN